MPLNYDVKDNDNNFPIQTIIFPVLKNGTSQKVIGVKNENNRKFQKKKTKWNLLVIIAENNGW